MCEPFSSSRLGPIRRPCTSAKTRSGEGPRSVCFEGPHFGLEMWHRVPQIGSQSASATRPASGPQRGPLWARGRVKFWFSLDPVFGPEGCCRRSLQTVPRSLQVLVWKRFIVAALS